MTWPAPELARSTTTDELSVTGRLCPVRASHPATPGSGSNLGLSREFRDGLRSVIWAGLAYRLGRLAAPAQTRLLPWVTPITELAQEPRHHHPHPWQQPRRHVAPQGLSPARSPRVTNRLPADRSWQRSSRLDQRPPLHELTVTDGVRAASPRSPRFSARAPCRRAQRSARSGLPSPAFSGRRLVVQTKESTCRRCDSRCMAVMAGFARVYWSFLDGCADLLDGSKQPAHLTAVSHTQRHHRLRGYPRVRTFSHHVATSRNGRYRRRTVTARVSRIAGTAN